jgi:hypothetical protein
MQFLSLSSSGESSQLSPKFGIEQVTNGELVSGPDVAKQTCLLCHLPAFPHLHTPVQMHSKFYLQVFPPTCFIQYKCLLLHSLTFASEWSIWNFLSCRERASLLFEAGERKDPSICINDPRHQQHS